MRSVTLKVNFTKFCPIQTCLRSIHTSEYETEWTNPTLREARTWGTSGKIGTPPPTLDSCPYHPDAETLDWWQIKGSYSPQQAIPLDSFFFFFLWDHSVVLFLFLRKSTITVFHGGCLKTAYFSSFCIFLLFIIIFFFRTVWKCLREGLWQSKLWIVYLLPWIWGCLSSRKVMGQNIIYWGLKQHLFSEF